MLSKNTSLIVATAIAPILWGTTYLTSTALLISDHPLLTATIRALPAGLILLAIARRLPRGSGWWRAAVLGVLNIGAFFALLFVAADRLPGGVAAVVGGIQPLLVAVIASRVLGERLNAAVWAAGVGGVVGVGLIVLQAPAGLDPIGIAAALSGAVSMAVGVVLTRRWSAGQPPIAFTAWQLIAGGLVLAIATAIAEPLPAAAPTPLNIAGYLYLTLVGTALAYLLWFRGLAGLPTRIPAFLGLLSPLVALALGTAVAHETLTWAQVGGIALVLLSIGVVVATSGGYRRIRRQLPRTTASRGL